MIPDRNRKVDSLVWWIVKSPTNGTDKKLSVSLKTGRIVFIEDSLAMCTTSPVIYGLNASAESPRPAEWGSCVIGSRKSASKVQRASDREMPNTDDRQAEGAPP